MQYRKRVVDGELERLLRVSGAVLIEGPRACGKTATAREKAESEVLLDTDTEAQALLEIDPAMILLGEYPRLIDEWQIAPSIWNHIRRNVDAHQAKGRFILTGSAIPNDDVTRHTGAGRITRMRMRPMSLYETGFSSGAVSLEAIMSADTPAASAHDFSLQDIADCIVIGGWPGGSNDPDDAAIFNASYLDDVCRADLPQLTDVTRDPERVRRFLRAYARHTSTLASTRTLSRDTGGSDGEDAINRDTARAYLDALVRVMVIEEQGSWAPHLRSKARLRSSAKRQFVDPSLAAAALGASSTRLVKDLELMGFLFESLTVRDLRVYAQPLRGSVLHYRDSSDLEVDAIVEMPDGQWSAFEVKLGPGQIDKAAQSLLKFVESIDTDRSGDPASLNVVTALGKYAYQRPDGVNVIPISTLGP